MYLEMVIELHRRRGLAPRIQFIYVPLRKAQNYFETGRISSYTEVSVRNMSVIKRGLV